MRAYLLLLLAAPIFLKGGVIAAGSADVAVGSDFEIPVTISSAADLYAFQFDLSFDPSVLQLQSIVEGSFLPSAGPTFFIPGTIDNVDGTATFNADTIVGVIPGAAGSGTLATFNFEATGNGTSALALSNIVLLDSSLDDISFSAAGGAVEVGSAVPEPRLGLLMPLGVILLALTLRPLSRHRLSKE